MTKACQGEIILVWLKYLKLYYVVECSRTKYVIVVVAVVEVVPVVVIAVVVVAVAAEVVAEVVVVASAGNWQLASPHALYIFLVV